MNTNLSMKAMTAILWLCVGGQSVAAIFPVNSPGEIGGATVLSFDGFPDHTVANSLYQDQGVSFTRDDGQAVFISDWSALGRTTTSPRNVLATIAGPGVHPWATHLNVLSSSPLFAIGAYFGNDQGDADFSVIRLSAFDLGGNLLGSVDVAANQNTSVDQFIGLRSDDPFVRVRFDNLNNSGTQSQSFSVVLDDLVFATVPEPSTVCLLGFGVIGVSCAGSRRKIR